MLKKMGELATCPNIVCKVGGATMAMNGFGWEQQQVPPSSEQLAEALLPFYGFVIDVFGCERIWAVLGSTLNPGEHRVAT